MNALHLAAQVSQVRIVDYLRETIGLSCLVNKGLDKPLEEETLRNRGNTDPGEKKDPFPSIIGGDTPLHIAMVNSLLRIVGINGDVVNKAGLTTFDIMRENTKYHESDRIILVLSNYPSKRKPFLYCTPKVSAEKQEVSIKMVNERFDARRNTKLVVVVLLAMSFTADFTIPSSFVTEVQKGEEDKLGLSILLGLASFKLFLIFDCVAFFLSLFVVLMW